MVVLLLLLLLLRNIPRKRLPAYQWGMIVLLLLLLLRDIPEKGLPAVVALGLDIRVVERRLGEAEERLVALLLGRIGTEELPLTAE